MACRSFDENGSYNPGKEIKAETQTYYQALIDNRDSPFVVSLQEPKPPICKTPEWSWLADNKPTECILYKNLVSPISLKFTSSHSKTIAKTIGEFFFLLILKKIRIKCILMLKAFCHCLYQYFPILLSIECVLSMFILGVISNINNYCLLSSFSWCYYPLQIIVNLIIYKLAHVFVYLYSFPNLEMVDILHFTWNISWYIF